MRWLSATLLSAGMAASPSLARADIDFAPAIAKYKPAVIAQIEAVRQGGQRLVERLTAKDIAGARKAWIDARTGWESSETITGGYFPALDKAIDQWPNATTGFHAIEAKLFSNGKPEELLAQAKALNDQLADLAAKVKTTDLTPQGLYDGMTGLAFEIGESKSKGRESDASGTSLNDIRANFQGVARLWETVFENPLAKKNPIMEARIDRDLTALSQLLNVPDIGKLDARQVEKTAEGIALQFVDAAPELGLKQPKLTQEN